MEIEVNGQKYGFKFTLLTMSEFCKKRKCSLSEYDEQFKNDPPGSVIDLLWAGNKVFNKGEEMSIYEVDDLMQAMSKEQLQGLMDEHAQGLISYYDKLYGDPESKKK